MTDSTIAGRQTRTAGPFSSTHGSKHLLVGENQSPRVQGGAAMFGKRKKKKRKRKQHKLLLLFLDCYNYMLVFSQCACFFIFGPHLDTATLLCN